MKHIAIVAALTIVGAVSGLLLWLDFGPGLVSRFVGEPSPIGNSGAAPDLRGVGEFFIGLIVTSGLGFLLGLLGGLWLTDRKRAAAPETSPKSHQI